jgi:hypothetical protein
MNSEEFYNEMKKISKSEDTVEAHRHMDDLMCELLELLGYKKGIEVFREQYKWYA